MTDELPSTAEEELLRTFKSIREAVQRIADTQRETAEKTQELLENIQRLFQVSKETDFMQRVASERSKSLTQGKGVRS